MKRHVILSIFFFPPGRPEPKPTSTPAPWRSRQATRGNLLVRAAGPGATKAEAAPMQSAMTRAEMRAMVREGGGDSCEVVMKEEFEFESGSSPKIHLKLDLFTNLYPVIF